jgi:hypothetical protein
MGRLVSVNAGMPMYRSLGSPNLLKDSAKCTGHKGLYKQSWNSNMLLDWVRQYSVRDDAFSLAAHQMLFNEFGGTKTELKSYDRKT